MLISYNMFDNTVAKYDTHSVAYDFEKSLLSNFPTCRIKINNEYFICVSLHKWIVDPDIDKSNRGLYLAVYTICNENDAQLKDINKKTLDNLLNTCNNEYITSIMTGSKQNNIFVFKFSVNCWRLVERKSKKWNYIGDKPLKDSEPLLQRLLT